MNIDQALTIYATTQGQDFILFFLFFKIKCLVSLTDSTFVLTLKAVSQQQTHRRWCPPAAGGCCAAGGGRGARGGAGRARLAGCAPSAPPPSPCCLPGPVPTWRRLCGGDGGHETDQIPRHLHPHTHHSTDTRSHFSSARALRAGLTERTPYTSSMSFTL